MILRLLDSDDSLDELTALIHRAYKALGDAGWNCTGVDQSVDVTRERIAEAECWVADSGGGLVGTILVRPPNETGDCDYFQRPGVSVINQFAVEPSLQGSGLGIALMNKAEDRAREMGATEIVLDTPEPAIHLVAWYRKRGYEIVGYVQWGTKTYRSAVIAKSLERGL